MTKKTLESTQGDTPLEIALPDNIDKLLLHCCCAPCSCAIIEGLVESGINPTLFFYNPNIHPEEEYIKRKNEIVRFAEKMKVPFIDADYDPDNWFNLVKGHETDPERGERCELCFGMRLDKTAQYAAKQDFPTFATSLGISRWKNLDHVNKAGHHAAQKQEVTYWDYNWRKKGGSVRMTEIIKKEGLYQQDYCGCAYSLRDKKLRG